MKPRAHFWIHGPILPLLVVQGKWARRRIPTLPEAEGPFEGDIDGSGPPLRLAMVGESTAAGVGVDRQHDALGFCLARALARRGGHAVRLQVVGRNGANLRQTREELIPKLVLPADVVVVITGVNDTLELTRGSRWDAELRKTITHLQARGAHEVVFSSIPPLGRLRSLPQPTRSAVGARARYLDSILRETCVATHAHYVKVEFPPRMELVARDGFHPSRQGYARWAEDLAAQWPLAPVL